MSKKLEPMQEAPKCCGKCTIYQYPEKTQFDCFYYTFCKNAYRRGLLDGAGHAVHKIMKAIDQIYPDIKMEDE